jgi:hypothetical protein
LLGGGCQGQAAERSNSVNHNYFWWWDGIGSSSRICGIPCNDAAFTMSNRTKILMAIAIVALAAASRLLKHPFNFTPVAAMALFAGCYLRKSWGIVLPLAAMLVSDYFIGFYDWQVMASVYAAIALAFAIGWFLAGYKKWYNVGAAALVSSLVFFILTNFSVWAFFDWYPHTWTGLISCFTLALPFFRNTLAGDIVYSALFFGAYEMVMMFLAKRLAKKSLAQEPVRF